MPKLLREYLQQQQEPFSINVHLHDRGYHKKGTVKIPSFFGEKGKQDESVAQNCSSFLNLVLSQIVSPNMLKNSRNGSQNCIRGEGNGNSFKFSSPSSTNDDGADVHCSVKDADADRILRKRLEDNKQLSPVSVLQGVESDEGSPICNQEQSSLMILHGKSSSTSTCHQMSKRTMCHIAEGQKQFSDSHSQYNRNKRALRQSRQLLIDCAREVIENQRKRDSSMEKIMRIDEVWRLVCENLRIWSRDYINETNIIHLVHSEFLASGEEWRKCSKQKRDGILMEIGDDILNDIINEIFHPFM